MPSQAHERIIEVIRERPALAADLLDGQLALKVPMFHTARLSTSELNDIAPTERRADAVVTLDNGGNPVQAVVVEVQLSPDKRKRFSWPAYVATLYARLRCPIELLVVCTHQKVADWCARPITVGWPDFVLNPKVVGPQQLPVITDLDTARRKPDLTIMSAFVNGIPLDPEPAMKALVTALSVIDRDPAQRYAEVLFSDLSAKAKNCLEEIMTLLSQHDQNEFATDYINSFERRGVLRGEAEALLIFLDGRGIDIPDDVRDRITDCTDHDLLKAWLRRAASIEKIQDLDEQFTDAR